ncbi:MAG: hypothetical protein WBD13_05390 [Burkholderiaceae bacterium]
MTAAPEFSMVPFRFRHKDFSTLIVRSHQHLARLASGLFTALTLTAISACGGAPADTTASNAAQAVELRLAGPATTVSHGQIIVKAGQSNLLDLDRNWSTWSGDSSGVTYDAQAGALMIPPGSDNTPMVIGVERFDLALAAGSQYTLAVQSSNPDMAAILFLFDGNGATVPVPGFDNTLAIVRSDSPLVFEAPGNIAGLYLQVQNSWQAPEAGSLTASLSDGSESGDNTGDNSDGNGGDDDGNDNNNQATELIDLAGTWSTWSGETSGVTADADAGLLTIAAPNANAGNRYGIQRFDTPLQAGQTYTLNTLDASDPNVSTLLFLFDGNGSLVPFSDTANGTVRNWLSANVNTPQSFTAPAGITSFVIQVQSAWLASASADMRPSLLAADEPGLCTPVLDSIGAPVTLPNMNLVRPSMSGDGSILTFQSNDDVIDGENNVAQNLRIYIYNNQTEVISRLLPASLLTGESRQVEAYWRRPVISGDGSTIFFQSNYTFLPPPASAVGPENLFAIDLASGEITRITHSEASNVIEYTVGVSDDGQRALFVGNAAALLDDSNLTQRELIEYNRATDTFSHVPLAQFARLDTVVTSDNLRYLAYPTSSVPQFENGIYIGNSSADYIFLDRQSGVQAVIAPAGDVSGAGIGHALDISGDGSVVGFKSPDTPFSAGGQSFQGRGIYVWYRQNSSIDIVNEVPAGTASVWSPSLSADGSRLVYYYRFIDTFFGNSIGRVHVVDLASRQSISRSDAGLTTNHPELSADGTRLVYHKPVVLEGSEGTFRRAVVSEVQTRCNEDG